jgi:hypothetical protein
MLLALDYLTKGLMVIGDQNAQDIEDIQDALDRNFPSPEEDLTRIAESLGSSPSSSQRYTEIRFLQFEVDSLIPQLRWHIGQALSLFNSYPQIADEEQYSTSNPYPGLPTRAHFLLRRYIANSEQVLFATFSEDWRGGTVAGWIFHMMVDDAIARSIAILDRLARIASLVADISFDNNRVYFRSKKLSKIHEKLRMPETQKLVDLSKDESFDLMLDYRDGWNHEKLAYSKIAGLPPVDGYTAASGQEVRIQGTEWTGYYLLALVKTAYHRVVEVLHEVSIICEQKAPNDRSNS